jgi:hypothetical protein
MLGEGAGLATRSRCVAAQRLAALRQLASLWALRGRCLVA